MVLRCDSFFKSCSCPLLVILMALYIHLCFLLKVFATALYPIIIIKSYCYWTSLTSEFRRCAGKECGHIPHKRSCVPQRESLKCAGLAESAFQHGCGCGRFCPVRCVCGPRRCRGKYHKPALISCCAGATLAKVSVFIRALLHVKSAHFPEYQIDASLVILKHALCW